MPDSIVKETVQEVEPLRDTDAVGYAARRVIESGLPALPVIDEDEEYAGLFGEREFMRALFPAYFDTLSSSAMISKTIDEAIERREGCGEEPIGKYLTTDNVVVKDEYSDTQLAELFLHHRVLIIPIATEGKVHAAVSRADFFRCLAERLKSLEDYGD